MFVTVVTATGCASNDMQSALDPGGPSAVTLESFWWFAFWTATAVYIVVIAALAFAMMHRRRRSGSVLTVDAPQEQRSTRWIVAATAATVGVLFLFLGVDLATSRSLGAMQHEPALRVRVTGTQWWWRIEYLDSLPNRTLVTANELHIPVGRVVELELETNDVIHSFWMPALGGKRDMIPGQKNRLWLQADSAGVYRGECAEFCGQQHAKMAFLVVAQDEAQFASWYNAQLASAAPPADTLRQEGLATFLGTSCALCHQVRGTPAAGQVGPDLTHVASRQTLAAGTIPNTRGHLGGWISDPQSIKPGTRMPPTPLSGPQLQALLAYLEGLR